MAGVAAASLLLGGCTSFEPDRAVPATVSVQPETFGLNAVDGEYAPAAWWTGFGDPVLDSLVADALSSNLDIVAAAARVRRANAQARIADAGLLPSVNATAGTSYRNAPLAGSGFGGFPATGASGDGGGQAGEAPAAQAPTRIETQSYTVGLGAAYEVDLFGRVRNDRGAARADALATAQDFYAVRLATAAEAIRTYFEIVDARRQIALTLETGDILADRVERTEERFARGLAESFEVYQVRQDLRTTQASLPSREAALAETEVRLAALLGTYPPDVRARLSQPLLPRLMMDAVPTGLPADLLAQRPDVAAAWARLEAARLRIGARRAERFPAIDLSASVGTQGDDPVAAFDIIDNWVLSLASNLVAPIFDAGRISGNIAVARATYDEAAAAYAQSVVVAHGEVVAALESYEEQRQRYRLLQTQQADAMAARDLQSRRFAAGVGSYVAVLDAMRALAQAESALSSAARDVAFARLGVHRALGGDWAPDAAVMPLVMIDTDGTSE